MSSQRKPLSSPPVLNSVQLLYDPKTLTVKELQKLDHRQEEMEPIEDYKYGGYMPVMLNENIGPNKEYLIIRKLGWGSFSTVWLCQDKSKKDDYYALKIMKSSNVGKANGLREIDVLRCIKTTEPDDVGFSRLLSFHTYFSERSMYGKHICIVNEVMGKSLLDLINQSDCEGLDQQGVKSIIKQVIQGLQYLHLKCQIIHTDIKVDNILVCAKNSYFYNMAAYVEQFEKKQLDIPRHYKSTWELTRIDEDFDLSDDSESESPSKSIEYYDDYYMDKPCKKNKPGLLFVNPNIEIKIADFGCAVSEGDTLVRPFETSNRALELILQAPCSFPIDMWAVGCLAFELSTGNNLFGLKRPFNVGAEEWQLSSIWKVIGGIPKHIALSGKKSELFFNSEGDLKCPPQKLSKKKKIQQILVEKYGWKLEEALVFEEFIMSLIQPDPNVRATALTISNKAWLKEN